MGACDVCYPPYRTVPFASYCLPDPQHALETFSTVVTAFGAIGASLDGRMTIQELDEMRRFVSSAPHILWEDLVASAPVVFGCIGAAFVYGLVWMVLIRLFAHLMVWVTVLSISAGCGIGAYYMWLTQASMKATARYGSADRLYTQQADYLYAGFFAVAGIGAAYTVAIVLLHRKLILAVKVMKEASRAVTGVPSTLLLPVITLSISVALLAGYGVVAVLLLSTGELEPTTPGFGHIFVPVDTCSWLALLTFACIWTLAFVRHLQHCAVAGALSTWYFADDKWTDTGCCTCFGSLGRAISQHAGSVAFGSVLITLLQMVRMFVIVVMKRLKACAGDSHAAKLACCCVTCCLGCIERCVRYLSRNAYVVMMVRGGGFCGSATEALSLLTRHMIRVAVLRSVGWSFLLLGKLFIVGASAGTGALILLTQPPWSSELFSIFPAVVAISIGSWFVGSAFMGVYNMSIDTVFLCYAIDYERAQVAGELQRSRRHQPAVEKLCDEVEAEAAEEDRKAAFDAAQGRGRSWFGRTPPRRARAVGDGSYPEVSAGSGLAEEGAGGAPSDHAIVEGVPVPSRGNVEMPTLHQSRNPRGGRSWMRDGRV